MALKHFKPTTPSQRQLVLIDRSELYKGKPVKTLVESKSSTGGRNNSGRITAFQKGGGHKKAYRLIDFKRRKFDVPARVERLEYDPNRSAFIALIKYEDGEQATSSRRNASIRATRSSRVSARISSRATRCRSKASRSVRSSTTWK
jgi:large subunit ribosomal protein L2